MSSVACAHVARGMCTLCVQKLSLITPMAMCMHAHRRRAGSSRSRAHERVHHDGRRARTRLSDVREEAEAESIVDRWARAVAGFLDVVWERTLPDRRLPEAFLYGRIFWCRLQGAAGGCTSASTASLMDKEHVIGSASKYTFMEVGCTSSKSGMLSTVVHGTIRKSLLRLQAFAWSSPLRTQRKRLASKLRVS